MSGAASPWGRKSEAVEPAPVARGRGWEFVDRIIERLADRLNPILVKEARQALKSRQFITTFGLLLLAGWGWSFMGVAMLSPGVYYAAGGGFMLSGYFVILIIPLTIVVPFAAYRSLAVEREDGTFELLSITTLSARQIVTGKLGSAVLQMLVFYCALAPCIVFTYMLGGVDIITIGYLLAYAFFVSLTLSAVGLVVATASRARHSQVLLSVLLIAGLLFGAYAWTGIAFVLVYETNTELDSWDFWSAQLAIVTFCLSHTWLFVQLAAAHISFASDNRSTRLRVALLAQQVLWIGWMLYFLFHFEQVEFLMLVSVIGAIYWYVAGACLASETDQMSPRARRALPQSYLGRMFLTWFNPGSGTGYAFTCANLLAMLLIVTSVGLVAQAAGTATARDERWVWVCVLSAAYAIAYLGVGRLLFLACRVFGPVRMPVAVVLQLIVASAGVGIPLFIEGWMHNWRIEYSPLQATNWMWTMNEAGMNGLGYGSIGSVVPWLVTGGAGAILLLNLALAMREVEQVRLATPQRVLDDDSPREDLAERP